MATLTAYEGGVCDCGFHESHLDPATNFYKFEQRTCPVCASSAKYGRILHAEDDEAEERVPEAARKMPGRARPDDGRRVMIRRKSPLEVALEKVSSPEPNSRQALG